MPEAKFEERFPTVHFDVKELSPSIRSSPNFPWSELVKVMTGKAAKHRQLLKKSISQRRRDSLLSVIGTDQAWELLWALMTIHICAKWMYKLRNTSSHFSVTKASPLAFLSICQYLPGVKNKPLQMLSLFRNMTVPPLFGAFNFVHYPTGSCSSLKRNICRIGKVYTTETPIGICATISLHGFATAI